VVIPVKTLNGGKPIAAQIKIITSSERAEKTNASGEFVIKNLKSGQKVRLEFSCNGITVVRELTPVSGTNRAIIVDFEKNIEAVLTVPQTLDSKGTGELTIKNSGSKNVSIQINVLSDGATASTSVKTLDLAQGESKVLVIDLVSQDKIKPYLIYTYLLVDDMPLTVVATGLAR
jgi:hypothetical protein